MPKRTKIKLKYLVLLASLLSSLSKPKIITKLIGSHKIKSCRSKFVSRDRERIDPIKVIKINFKFLFLPK